MAEMKIVNMAGAEVGTIALADSVFACEINGAVLHAAVKSYLGNQRQGTQSTLTRTEVSGDNEDETTSATGNKAWISNYNERRHSFRYMLFKDNADTSVDNVTNPYLPWTFAEFHADSTDEWSVKYMDYYMNTIREGVVNGRYATDVEKQLIADAGYTLDKTGDNTWSGVGVEKGMVLHNGPAGEITLDQLATLDFVGNYAIAYMLIEFTDANGNIVHTYTNSPANHYQRNRPFVQIFVDESKAADYADGNHNITVSIHLLNGELIEAYSAKLLPAATASEG